MKKHIPNTITCCNLICGCIATLHAANGMIQLALLFIILGAVFDFFDGMSARCLHVSSEIGKELDSLADDITFGFAPATIVFYELEVMDYPAFLESLRHVLPYVAFVIAAFSAIRLAKFNLDTRQSTSFIGLPTPANALFWGSLMAGFAEQMEAWRWFLPVTLLGIVLSSWILIAEIPMFALKFKQWGWKGNEVRYGFIGFSAAVLLATIICGITTEKYNICYSGFSIIIVTYVLVSILINKRTA